MRLGFSSPSPPADRPRYRRLLWRFVVALAVASLGAAGAAATLGLGGPTRGRLGPSRVELQAQWGGEGRTQLGLPPLGTISARTHDGPLRFRVRVDELDVDRVQALLARGDPQAELRRELARDIDPLVRRFARRRMLVAAAVGLLVAAVLPHRRPSWLALGAVGGAVATGALLWSAWLSYDELAFSRPRFEGPIERAPDVLRSVRRHARGVSQVRTRVDALGVEMAELYRLAVAPPGAREDDLAILHISDIHLNPLGLELAARLAREFRVSAVLDTGDLTSFGYPLEARIGELIAEMGVPYYLTPGNHDSEPVRAALAGVPNLVLLRGTTAEIGDLRVLGVADPTFTADNRLGTEEAAEAKRRFAEQVKALLDTEHPDVLAVHDPVLAESAAGKVPLVLAGHGHRRGDRQRLGTRFLSVGSTGATGLGSFTVSKDLAYEAQVLHFSARRLLAVDYVSLRGVQGNFRIDRTVVGEG